MKVVTRRGTPVLVAVMGALVVMEVQAMARRVEDQEMEAIEVWAEIRPAPRSPRLNSNTAQNNPPSNKHNNVANFDASSCFLPWTEDPRSYLLSRLP